MTLEGIKEEVDIINDDIVSNALKGHLSLKELVALYTRLLQLNYEFINLNYSLNTANELESVRFSLQEGVINIIILIKERLGKDTMKEVKKLEELYKISEKIGGVEIE